jgi:hypothetical protein
LGQDSVYPVQYVLNQAWPMEANKGRKGVYLPNLSLRDQMVEAIRKADVVGILAKNDKVIHAPVQFKRELTDQIFDYYKIKPLSVCDAVVSRKLPDHEKFWEIIKGRRILLISRWADKLKQKLRSKPYDLNVSLSIPFLHYDQMQETLKQIHTHRDDFDIALISCGVNAVVLAHKVAEAAGKIGIDFGKSSEFIVKGRVKYKG